MLVRVTLTAPEVQVTASSEDEARRFAAEDAREFASDWTYEVRAAEPAGPGDDLTANGDDLEFGLELVDGRAGRSEFWTFTLVTEVVVEAASLGEARELAPLVPGSMGRLLGTADLPAMPRP